MSYKCINCGDNIPCDCGDCKYNAYPLENKFHNEDKKSEKTINTTRPLKAYAEVTVFTEDLKWAVIDEAKENKVFAVFQYKADAEGYQKERPIRTSVVRLDY
jgi:hypothetical protein